MAEETRTKGQKMKEELFYTKKSVFETESAETLEKAKEYAKGYASWLDSSKTEREAVETSIGILKAAGFKEYKLGDKISAGDKLYLSNRGKSLFVIRVGTENLENGMRIAAAHVDSPRLDLKQHPLYESEGIGYLKTHYYGGIRKYQWVTIPLALHGVVTKKNGETIKVRIGDEPGDPAFCITDLLPHLARRQSARTLGSAFDAEGLNIMLTSSPYIEEDGKVTPADEKFKLNAMIILNEKYGITESDFMSAELCIVPAENTVDIGIDRWLIGGYGHDDRVCAYPEITGIIANEDPAKTCMIILADKEEIGSEGISGMQCRLISDIIDEISRNLGANPNVVRNNSCCLSADVTAAYDPNYSDVYEKRNSAILHCGVGMAKYVGSGGKSGTNDASAELVGMMRSIFDDNGVIWQTAELGKVDEGGGGTVAMYIANENIPTIDVGVPVLSMHAPFEIISKADIYEMHKAFTAFFR